MLNAINDVVKEIGITPFSFLAGINKHKIEAVFKPISSFQSLHQWKGLFRVAVIIPCSSEATLIWINAPSVNVVSA